MGLFFEGYKIQRYVWLTPLNDYSGFTASMMDDELEETVAYQNDPIWSPIASLSAKDESKYPHFIIFMSHYDTEGDDNHLLRGELLTILAMMITRMEHPSFEKHCIIPVSIFFFFLNYVHTDIYR